MKIDLAVYPINWAGDDCWFADSKLELDRHIELFEALQTLPKVEVKVQLSGVFDSQYYHNRTVDNYGQPLTYLKSRWLAAILKYSSVGVTTPWNKRILLFLASLDPETPIVLYWH